MVALGSAYELILKKFGSLTEVQKTAFPIIEQGSNCLIIAPTGSGKTEAALVPVLDYASKNGGDGVIALYITPLRALNRDLMRRLEVLGMELGVTIAVRHGDTKA